jgi:DNA-binding response OmpR family regulator
MTADFSRSLSVLVVDDDQDMREYLHDFFSAEGFEVTTLADPTLAVPYVRDEMFHVCVLDLMMPKISGLDLLAQIRAVDEDIAVVILTGYPSVETVTAAIQHDISAYIHKPFIPEDFRNVLRRIAKNKGLVLNLERYFHTEIGRAIRTLRMARRLTLKQLSRRTGLTARLLSRIELASTTANLSDLLRIAQALDCDPTQLLPRTNADPLRRSAGAAAPPERDGLASKTAAIRLVPLVVGGMMHDMRNDLATLAGSLGRLKRTERHRHVVSARQVRKANMSSATWAVERLRAIVDLLHTTVASYYDSSRPATMDVTSLGEVGAACRKRFRHSAPEATLRIRGFASIPRLALPRGLAQWAIEELVQNAVNACARHKRFCTVTLTASYDRSSKTLKVTATDTGPGFPDHILAQYGDSGAGTRADTPSHGHGLSLLSSLAGRLDGALLLRKELHGARIDLIITVGASDAA